MGSYERDRGGNAPRGGRCATTDRVTPVAVQRSPGTWRSRCLERVLVTVPGQPVTRAAWRVCGTSRHRRGVCAPTLKPLRSGAELRRKAKPPNRTREIRPSGMTTGAVGNISHGGIVKPPRNRKSGDLDTLHLKLVRQRSTQTHRRGPIGLGRRRISA